MSKINRFYLSSFFGIITMGDRMNHSYDEEFFCDLDKTTDLLKAFKPRVSVEEPSFILEDNTVNLSQPDINEKKNFVSIENEVEEVRIENTIENSDLIESESIVETNVLPKSDIGAIMEKIDLEIKKRQQNQEELLVETNDTKSKNEVRRHLIFNKIELAFCLVSIIFIIGCIAYLVRA